MRLGRPDVRHLKKRRETQYESIYINPGVGVQLRDYIKGQQMTMTEHDGAQEAGGDDLCSGDGRHLDSYEGLDRRCGASRARIFT